MACTTLDAMNEGVSVADMVAVGDSSFAVLYPDARELIVYDRLLHVTRRVAFDKDGPRGIIEPVSAALSDTAIYVADGAGLLKRFDLAGADRAVLRLTFIPRRVRVTANHAFVTPLVAGASPAQLLFQIGAAHVRPIQVPIVRYQDIGINTFANMTSVAAFPDRIAVLHEMVVPFGYVLKESSGPSSLQRFAVPLPDAARSRLEDLPAPPITESNVNALTMIAFAAAPNLRTGSTYYVTRVPLGRNRFPKLLVELDSAMRLRSTYPIDANPHHMVYLGARGSIIGVDANSEWFECKLP